MRWLVVLCLFASIVRADDLADGQELARTGQFNAAIPATWSPGERFDPSINAFYGRDQ